MSGAFKAFLSHKYKADKLNLYFFELFSDVAQIQFEVDEGKKSTSVTRLERKIRQSSAFIGFYPFYHSQEEGEFRLPPDAATRVKQLRVDASYFLLEMSIAQRIGIPTLIFYDRAYEEIFDLPKQFLTYTFDTEVLLGAGANPEESIFRRLIADFCNEVKSSKELQDLRSITRKQVGVFLPSDYPSEAKGMIENILPDHGFPRILSPGKEGLTLSARSEIDNLDIAIVDVGPNGTDPYLLGNLHGLGLPQLRLAYQFDSSDIHSLRSAKALFPDIDAGYQKDIVCWKDSDELKKALNLRLDLLTYRSKYIGTPSEAKTYFRSAAKLNQSIFISYTDADRENPLVTPLLEGLKNRFQVVFDYRDKHNRVPPGDRWQDEIIKRIATSSVGIALLSKTYSEKPNCIDEAQRFYNQYLDGKMKVFPIWIRDDKVDFPLFSNIQYMRASQYNSAEELLEIIVSNINSLS